MKRVFILLAVAGFIICAKAQRRKIDREIRAFDQAMRVYKQQQKAGMSTCSSDMISIR